ncbi:class I SAM-dependent methyltransferase [Stenotrophomonas pictorum]|uniref:class I SAM-dependent methyltransferase n=1 Tax=Stenotrophomonas pictorum TaxID=86184 RepID=UPI000ACDDBB0|nr:class I SAM-dependent methyltransferase [Stenotrophomonas pictorum]
MRELEHRTLLEQLRAVPAQPWLWMGPAASWLPVSPPQGRGIRLHPHVTGPGYDGDLRCSLPLPLPAESVNAIVLQHVAAEQAADLLAECARILMPGGRLWMTLLNRCSPYRTHWQWQGARPPSAGHCRMLIQRQGLRCTSLRHLGPLLDSSGAGAGTSLAALRAICVLSGEKRTTTLTAIGQLRTADWRRPLAT